MLNLNSFLLFSENPKKLSDFYEKIISRKPDWNEGEYFGFQIGSCYLTIGPHEKVKAKSKEPERLIMNFETPDVAGEFERVKKLGVKVVTKPYNPMEASEVWIATFEDIDGNYFQLMSPMDLM